MTLELQIRPVARTDEAAVQAYVAMLVESSLYPKGYDPTSHVTTAEAIFGAHDGNGYVGFAYLSHLGSPDDKTHVGKRFWWFEDSVSKIEGKGVNSAIEDECRKFLRGTKGPILSSSLDVKRDRHLTRRGWVERYDTVDAFVGKPIKVFMLPRARL